MEAVWLTPTRVHRFYRGGALIAELRGERAEDGFLPEEWIGSVTPANNPGRADPEEGLSRLVDGRLLRDAVADDPIRWLGKDHVARFGVSTGVLVKLLDAAERLPVHAHPDRSFAGRAFDSPFGKTEAWLVLRTRHEEAEVWAGLADEVEPERFLEWIRVQDVEALLDSLNRVPVRAGDVVYVPAGVPHALGAGLLIAEVQEPTDFSLLCEWRDFPVDEEDSHLGLGWDEALKALDLGAHSPIRTLPPESRAFFEVDERVEASGRFAVVLVVDGHGSIDGVPAGPGDALAVPAAAGELRVEGDLRALRFLAPDPEA